MTTEPLRVRRAAQHQSMPWANGGGTTREVAAVPSAGDWVWRLSIADVAADGPFSRFPGVSRSIALLRGHGFVLRVGDAAPVSIVEPYRPFDFDGAATTECTLAGGPVVDLNLMQRDALHRDAVRRDAVRRDVQRLELRFIHLAVEQVVHESVVAALVVAGSAVSDHIRLDPFDALVGGTDPQPLRIIGGEQGAVVAVVAPEPARTV